MTDGNFFEDFRVGQHFRHATPRTLTCGDAAAYIGLTGARHPLHCSVPLARALGYRGAPLDDLLVFNTAFGKTVPDISLNAVANLGYADVRFIEPVYGDDTIQAESEVIGIRETSGGESGVVYVRSTAFNQDARPVLTWIRWVLVRKRDLSTAAPDALVPALPEAVSVERLSVPSLSQAAGLLEKATSNDRFWGDYSIGQRIDHPAGMTLEEADHIFATRLYQNNAKVHFDALAMQSTQHGRRLVYGGHVISVCRALSYDGLENVMSILAINAGSHVAPTFAGDTLYGFTEVLDKFDLPGRDDCGALRLRLTGIRNNHPVGFPAKDISSGKARYNRDVVLDLDYTVLIPKNLSTHIEGL